MLTLEREIEHLKGRLTDVERAQTTTAVGAEMRRIESELAPIEAVVHAKRIEAEVKAAAIRLEAAAPHYPCA